MLLAVRKDENSEYGKSFAVYAFETVEGVANFVEADAGDIHWQLKRTGRWDSEDRKWLVVDEHPFDN